MNILTLIVARELSLLKIRKIKKKKNLQHIWNGDKQHPKRGT